MKHTDKFFLFPVKVYNEDFNGLEEDDIAGNKEWVLGYARLPIECLYDIIWYDTYSLGKNVEDVSKDGCDLTGVYHERYGKFTCLLPRKKFENKLNDYIEKIEKELSDKIITD